MLGFDKLNKDYKKNLCPGRRTGEQSMEAQSTSQMTQDEFALGSFVIYSVHGKCQLLAIENRSLGTQCIPFYKLEVKKSNLSRSAKLDPTIWVPVSTAKDRGLRKPMTQSQAEDALKILMS